MKQFALSIPFFLSSLAPNFAAEGSNDLPLPEVLDSLYIAVALIEYCQIEIPLQKATDLARAGRFLEMTLDVDRQTADERYLLLKEVMIAQPPSCDESDPTIQSITSLVLDNTQ